MNRHQNQVICTSGSKDIKKIRLIQYFNFQFMRNQKIARTFDPDVRLTWFLCLSKLFFNFLKALVNDFYPQVALSSSCKKSQFWITFHRISPLDVISPGPIIPQKIAKTKTFNLRYFKSNSDLFEGGKQLFVYKSEQMT